MSTSATGDGGSKSPRRAIPKRVRFEVLRRDNYTCKYCRSTENELTLDHLVPVVLGGTDEPANLVAACKDCNAGKSSSSPDAATVAQVSEDAMRWSAAMQVAAGLMADQLRNEWDYAEALDAEWSTWTYGYHNDPIPRPDNWRRSANSWRIAGLPVELLVDAAQRALESDKVFPHGKWKYFCGIAWSRVRQLQEAAKASLGDGDEDDDCSGNHSCECEVHAYDQGVMAANEHWTNQFLTYQSRWLRSVVDAQGLAWIASH